MGYEDHLSDQAIDVLRYGFGLRLPPDQVDDALAWSFDLARRRAEQQYGRPPTPVEVALVGSLLCWYPLKGPPSKSYAEAIAPVQVELFERGIATALWTDIRDDAEMTSEITTSEVTTNLVDFLSNASTDELLDTLVAISDQEPTTGPRTAYYPGTPYPGTP